MYSEWVSLSSTLQSNASGAQSQSVLNKFPASAGKEVAVNVVRQLASNLGITQNAEPSHLVKDEEVLWCMDVICYGLSLPLQEHETIKDCVNVYCEWMTALHPNPKICVPKPIIEDPNMYCRKIINHFHNLFVPRHGESTDVINRQTVLCHRVLRTLQQTAQISQIIERETWEVLLLFLLAINDILLAPPTVKDDVGDQLCERVLSVLFEVWLLACVRCFPSPSLWKTLQETCCNWRHRITLVEQWNRVNLILTARLLEFSYGSSFPELKVLEEDAQLIPAGMTNDCIAQTWYRFLRIIGSPVALCSPHLISKTQHFVQWSLMRNNGNNIEPYHHPCLLLLPQIFLKAIKGISSQVDAFLGLSKAALIGLTTSRSSVHPPLTPNSGPPSSSSISSIPTILGEIRAPLANSRPKCNSILHLFGEWLFEAAHIGSDAWIQNTKRQATEASRRPSSMIMENRKGSISLSQPNSLIDYTKLPSDLTIDKYESGRAEAIGALCRIFCAKKTGEEILPVYLARFYMGLQQCLKVTESKEFDETLASILINSSDIFRLDLDGIQVLLPGFISALELILPEKNLKIKSQLMQVNKTELRRASINILLSILTLPLHFQTLPIRDLSNGPMDRMITFAQLKPRMINILMNALQVETDAQNNHMLLGGLLLTVQDAVAYEESEMGSNESMQTPSSPQVPETNLLSSDNAHALFVRATYLVCHRLISSWKTDLNVSLAALELLTGLARLHIRDSDALECKRAVKWICDYICYQCSRPPPAHSKDLHSTIVAAFQCTSAWLMQHPYLLQDKDCLNIVLEVVELGISGSKSIGKMGDTPKFKDEKELKPVSMRVRDAAENLLTIILEQVGYFPSECGPESVSSLLDETALVKHCNSVTTTDVTLEMAVQKFKYFVTENSTILALLEEPLGNDQDPQPTVTLLIRGPFGRHAWTMQLRHLPRSKSGTKYHAVNPGRPIPMNDQPQCLQLDQRFFPEIVDKIAPCVADYSIPTLDQIRDEYGSEQIKRLEQMLENQYVFEKLAWAETDNSLDGLSHAHEAVPPNICHEFQAARLFLSHFGFLSFDDSNKKESELVTSTNRLLTALDTKKQNFCYDLDLLDKLSPRTYDTVHVFYVKNGQSNCQEIIGNMNDDNIRMIDPHFWNMLQTLGWPVEIDEHSGWTGFVWNSWALKSATKSGQNDHSKRSGASGLFDMRFNGESRVLYWADVSSEIAFVVPTEWNGRQENTDGNCSSWNSSVGNESINSSAQSNSSVWYDNKSDSSSTSEQSLKPSANQKPRTLSLDIDKAKEPIPPARKRTGVLKSTIQAQSSAKIFLVWLESFEDHINFPIDGLLPYTRTGEESQTGQIIRSSDCHIIFLHALQSGLLRVKLQGPVGRMSFATPLVDGMVLSRRVVGNLVRQTAFNMSKRRRLDNDSYQPPHVRRRLKVQDIVQKYKIELTEPELLAHLFANS
ncbi:ral GTPase-activating protein subunit beta isoform X15 [Condylostylus longicornis]|uniref:ral GTPase-activating protein subunit beta isoform X15 n=1 Tax=Condylostylus longicornis TaxID=2530218 RepID=UPI00244E0FB7|nr:ral GTPase-activating protein subunit beta isoform X15 [Condylostylus longicornis]